MANSNKYKELEERIKLSDDPTEQTRWLATMVFMIANNDLATIEKRVKKIEKVVYFVTIILLLGFLGANQIAWDWALKLIGLF